MLWFLNKSETQVAIVERISNTLSDTKLKRRCFNMIWIFPVNTRRFKNVFKTSFVRYGCFKDVSETSCIHWVSTAIAGHSLMYQMYHHFCSSAFKWSVSRNICFFSRMKKISWSATYALAVLFQTKTQIQRLALIDFHLYYKYTIRCLSVIWTLWMSHRR